MYLKKLNGSFKFIKINEDVANEIERILYNGMPYLESISVIIKDEELKADEIECRIAQVTAKGCSLLLYKTARVDRAILDETFGNRWQNDFKVIDGKMFEKIVTNGD